MRFHIFFLFFFFLETKSDSCILLCNLAVAFRLFLSDRTRIPKLHGFGLPRAQAQTWWAAVLNNLPRDSCLHFSSRNSAFSLGWGFTGGELPGRTAAYSLLTQALHPTIFQGSRYLTLLLLRDFCAGRDQKKGTKTPISKKKHNFSDCFFEHSKEKKNITLWL